MGSECGIWVAAERLRCVTLGQAKARSSKMEFNSPTFHQPIGCRKQLGEGLLILSLNKELPNGLGGNYLTQLEFCKNSLLYGRVAQW